MTNGNPLTAASQMRTQEAYEGRIGPWKSLEFVLTNLGIRWLVHRLTSRYWTSVCRMVVSFPLALISVVRPWKTINCAVTLRTPPVSHQIALKATGTTSTGTDIKKESRHCWFTDWRRSLSLLQKINLVKSEIKLSFPPSLKFLGLQAIGWLASLRVFGHERHHCTCGMFLCDQQCAVTYAASTLVVEYTVSVPAVCAAAAAVNELCVLRWCFHYSRVAVARFRWLLGCRDERRSVSFVVPSVDGSWAITWGEQGHITFHRHLSVARILVRAEGVHTPHCPGHYFVNLSLPVVCSSFVVITLDIGSRSLCARVISPSSFAMTQIPPCLLFPSGYSWPSLSSSTATLPPSTTTTPKQTPTFPRSSSCPSHKSRGTRRYSGDWPIGRNPPPLYKLWEQNRRGQRLREQGPCRQRLRQPLNLLQNHRRIQMLW